MDRSTREKNIVNREMPGVLSGISAKMIQYLMLVMLLVLVFVVSAYAGKLRAGRRTPGAEGAQGGTGQDGPGDSAPDGPENSVQGGTADSPTGDAQGTGAGQDVPGGSAQDGPAEGAGTGQDDSTGDAQGVGAKGTIVLDAGHGGFDPGVSGASGVPERELNLTLAKKLGALLEAEGYRVVQTRPTEAGLYDEGQSRKKAQDMQRRCAIIEREQPLLTVSIHQNSYPDSSVSGPQVFYFAQSEEGERLASCIQSCMNGQLEPEAPKSHKGNESYYILRRSAGTTVIVECGFLTNPQEEAKLLDGSYQDRVAGAVRDGILEYLKDKTNKNNTSKL